MPPKFASPVDAARLAAQPPTVPMLRPPLERVLVHAAVLWCRDLRVPTVRALAASVGRAPSVVLNGFHHVEEIYAEVIRGEWDFLEHDWYGRSHPDRADWLTDHALELAEVDRALLRLPALVHTAVAAAGRIRVPSVAPYRSLALHALASVADGPGRLPRRSELHRFLLAVDRAAIGPLEEVRRTA